MSNDKIFDTNNISDLPEEVKKQSVLISKKEHGSTTPQVKKLFEIKSTLTVNEVIIGLYRTFGVIKKRANVQVCLANLVKTNKLIKLDSNTYKLADNTNASEG